MQREEWCVELIGQLISQQKVTEQFFLSKTAKTHTRNFFAFFSGGLDPDLDPYLPAAMLDSPPVCSVDPAATIFPGKSSLSGLLSKLTLPWRTKTK